MATKKDIKLTYDLNKLFEEYDNYLATDFLPEEDKIYIATAPESIETLKDEIKKANIRLVDVEKFLSANADSRTNDEITKELNGLESKIETVRVYMNKANRLKELNAKGDTISVEEIAEKEIIITEITKLQIEVGLINEFVKENFEGSFDKVKEIIKKDKEQVDARNEKEKLLLSIKSMTEGIENLKTKSDKLKKSLIRSVDSFKLFLESKDLSTSHAEEIYNYHYDPKTKLTMAKGTFKIRKTHPKRDAFIKKVVVPTLVTAGAAAAVGFGIAASGLVGGSTVMGIIPVSGTPGLTAMATSMLAGATALVATPAIILSKNALTRAYYKVAYKDAKTNLERYENGTELENLPITSLIEKIEKTKHSVLESNYGSAATKPFRFIKRHYLNAINRNRIHHLEAYTKSLTKMYSAISHNESITDAEKAVKLKPIFELLKNVEEFISKDVLESKTYSMLTCKEDGKHTHKATIENIDIFANLTTFVDAIAKAETEKEQKAKMKLAKKETKNIKQKTATATEILNGGRLITRMLGYESTYERFTPSSSTEYAVVSTTLLDSGDKVILQLNGGKSVEFATSEIGTHENISSIKLGKNKTIIKYADGSTKELLKTKKVIPEIETAKRVVLCALTDENFVDELKSKGYDKKTLKSLTSKLEKAVADPTSKQNISRSTKIGQCYLTCLELIKEASSEYDV